MVRVRPLRAGLGDTHVGHQSTDISGRLYSTLNVHPWLRSSSIADRPDIKSLMGLADGTLLLTQPQTWSSGSQPCLCF